MKDHGSLLESGVLQVAGMMEIAARTAPKSKGEDYIETLTLTGDKISELAEAILEFGRETGRKNFDRDSKNVRESSAVVLIGLRKSESLGLDCGACGYPDCASLDAADVNDGDFRGPICSYRQLDLGIALGSAVKTAQIFNVDNRIMYRAGVAARHIGQVDWDFVMGIPLSAAGKNIYFDRK